MTAATPAQRQLLGYYLSAQQLAEPESPLNWYYDSTSTRGSDSVVLRPPATRAIAKFLRDHTSAGQQSAIFKAIRDYLDDQLIAQPMNNQYITPSYLGKFWLNRYLRTATNHKLPKLRDVTRVIVIFVVSRSRSPSHILHASAHLLNRGGAMKPAMLVSWTM